MCSEGGAVSAGICVCDKEVGDEVCCGNETFKGVMQDDSGDEDKDKDGGDTG